jgi:hypothetical protein
VYHTTGFTKDQITELCSLVNKACVLSGERPWPPILGLYQSTVVALTYLRRNRVQAEIAEAYGVSQSTISRAVAALTRYSARSSPSSRGPAPAAHRGRQPAPVLVMGGTSGAVLR